MTTCIAVIKGPIDLHARWRRIARVAVRDLLHGTIYQRVCRITVEGEDQSTTAIGISADGGTADDDVAAGT